MILTLRLLGLEVIHIELAQPINVAWRPGEGIDHVPESPYEE